MLWHRRSASDNWACNSQLLSETWPSQPAQEPKTVQDEVMLKPEWHERGSTSIKDRDSLISYQIQVTLFGTVISWFKNIHFHYNENSISPQMMLENITYLLWNTSKSPKWTQTCRRFMVPTAFYKPSILKINLIFALLCLFLKICSIFCFSNDQGALKCFKVHAGMILAWTVSECT